MRAIFLVKNGAAGEAFEEREAADPVPGAGELGISDERPEVLGRCLRGVTALALSGALKPIVGGRFNVSKIAEAHALLESRRSTGKIVVAW